MNTTQPDKHQARLCSFSPAMSVLALDRLDQPDWLNVLEERRESAQVEFANHWEEEFARRLDEHQISWQYKHRTFAVEWDEEGNFVDSFTPDFYIPTIDAYVELVAGDYRSLGAKARKVRLLQQQHPNVRIELLSAATSSSVLEMLS